MVANIWLKASLGHLMDKIWKEFPK